MDPHTIKSKFPFHSLSHTYANVSSPPSLGEKNSWLRQPFQECHVSSSKQNSMRLLTSVRSQAVSLQRYYSNFCPGQRSAHLWQEVQTLLSKGTVEIAPQGTARQAFSALTSSFQREMVGSDSFWISDIWTARSFKMLTSNYQTFFNHHKHLPQGLVFDSGSERWVLSHASSQIGCF